MLDRIRKLEDELGVRIAVTNMVAVAEFGRVDLSEIQRREPARCKYDPWSFPALFYYGEGFTAIVPSSGRVTIVGVKSAEQLQDAVAKLEALLGRTHSSLKLRNVCVVIDIGKAVDMEDWVTRSKVFYDTAVFSGAIGERSIVFASGKVIVTGLNEQNLEEVVRKVVLEVKR